MSLGRLKNVRQFVRSFNFVSAKFSTKSSKIEKRNANYSVLSDADLSFFESLIGSSKCVTNSNDLAAFNTDWLRTCEGNSKVALLPKTTQELLQDKLLKS